MSPAPAAAPRPEITPANVAAVLAPSPASTASGPEPTVYEYPGSNLQSRSATRIEKPEETVVLIEPENPGRFSASACTD